jgi:tetratricopeptide (TPR) repeat protein
VGIPAHEAEHLLNVLAKAHLVNHDVAHRYRLHDLLRRYAEDQVVREESEASRTDAIRRLLDWFVLSSSNAAAALAPDRPPVPDLPSPDDVTPLTFGTDDEAMVWCDAERGDFTAMTRTAIDHGYFRHGWQIPDVLHDAVERHGRLDHVLELLELALVAAGLDRHQRARVGTLSNIGSVYFLLRDYDRAGSYFARGLRLAREIGYPDAEAACAHNLASVHLKSGDVATAIDLYQRQLKGFRDTDDPSWEASTSHRLGEAYRQVGRFDEARESYLRALAIREQIGSLRGQGDTHRELADLFLLTGDHLAALKHCRRALDIHRHTRDEAARCDALITMADVKRALGRHREAVQDGSVAADLACEIGDAQRRCQALTVLAEALAAIGDRKAAERVCDQAFALVDQLDPGMSGVRQRLLRVRGNPGAADGGGRPHSDA